MTRVLRLSHSAVVGEWRTRERLLRAAGFDLQLICPRHWNEGGSDVVTNAAGDEFVTTTRTIGSHPFVFVFNPLPIWRALRRSPIDVLDVHEEPASLAALEALVLRSLSRRRPAVLFYCAENLPKRYPIPFRWIEKLALRRASAVYCCNTEAGTILRSKGFRGRLETLGLGIDGGTFSPGASDVPRPPVRVGFIGRLDERKGVAVLIDALAQLDPSIVLDVFGTGPDRDRLAQRAVDLGIAGRVQFHGFVDHDALPDVLRSLHVVCVPSQTTPTWVEQFGRVAIEAMACGVPVITSDSGALPQVVGDAAVVVSEADIDGWARAISGIVADETARRHLGEQGRVRAADFSWESIAARHGELYRNVLR
jgi:glycosyltransferase involved in cell wall biosynthesis